MKIFIGVDKKTQLQKTNSVYKKVRVVQNLQKLNKHKLNSEFSLEKNSLCYDKTETIQHNIDSVEVMK